MNKKTVLLIALFFLFGVSCTPASQITQSLPLASTSSTSEGAQAVILTATLLPGLSPPPSPEYPKLVTPRVTPFPTRTYAEIRDELSRMLKTNGNCALPCFWGIQPDQTRYEELYGVIDHLGGTRFENLQANGHFRVSTDFRLEGTKRIIVEFQADLQDDVVKDLKVALLNQLDTGITPADWSAYNLDKVLKIYGVPDRVELYSGGPNNSLTFGVTLIYNEIHTSIMYYGITTELDKYLTPTSIIFCPETIGIDSVVLHIGKHPFNMEPDGIPLIIGLSLMRAKRLEFVVDGVQPVSNRSINRA